MLRMTSDATPPSLDEDAWDDLLSYIEERRVIPIIGQELLEVETDAGPRPLYELLAERLAARLGIDAARLPQPLQLNDVVNWYAGARGRREEAYVRLRAILRDLPCSPPAALRRLAAIDDFDLFVTTTFDPLLEQALVEERGLGDGGVDVLSYAPNRVVDLARERSGAPGTRPVVYHLFGKVAASPTYVISDEDILEYMCALQGDHLVPEKLFHELETNHLLFIGSNFNNWLARLFLRMAKRRRLSDPRDVTEVMADSQTAADERLMEFLQHVSVRTRVYAGAARFAEELHGRWLARRRPRAAAPAGPERIVPPSREMPDNAIFISYAREDLAAVQRLKAGLDAAGLTTWFDVERLEAGDDFDLKIRRNIARCAFFVPVISATTERRREAWFRREWNYAIDRTRNMADGSLFILPVIIDGTDGVQALVPDLFKALHFTTLPGGAVTPEFAARLAGRFGQRDGGGAA
jgi:hypothetical protein